MLPKFSLDPAFRDSDKNTTVEEAWYISPDSLCMKGIDLASRGMNEEALKIFDKALKIDPKFAEALYNKAEVLIKLNRKNEADECYNRLINLSDRTLEHLPENVSALEKKGNALMMLGKCDEALNCYGLITRVDPKNLGALKNIVELDPGNAKAWNNMGSAFYNRHEYEESLKSYDKAIDLEPKFPIALCNKGVVLGKLGKYDEAIECYEAAIRFNPQHAKAWYSKGITLHDQGNYLEAIQCFDEAIKLNPRYAKAWYQKGLIFAKQKEFEIAINAFHTAVEIDPQYDKAQDAENRAAIYSRGFTPIVDLNIGMLCNVSGFVTGRSEAREFQRADGTTGLVANINISDGTGQIKITLWDNQVKLIDGVDLGYKAELADCYVKSGWIDRELSCNWRTKITFAPPEQMNQG